MKDIITKALGARQKGGILKDEYGAFYVPSSDGLRTYIVSESGICNCQSWTLCHHLLATVYLDAFLAIQLMRWSDTLEWLEAVIDQYSVSVEMYPQKVRDYVRSEHSLAVKRIAAVEPVEQTKGRYRSREVKRDGESLVVASRQEAPKFMNGIQVI